MCPDWSRAPSIRIRRGGGREQLLGAAPPPIGRHRRLHPKAPNKRTLLLLLWTTRRRSRRWSSPRRSRRWRVYHGGFSLGLWSTTSLTELSQRLAVAAQQARRLPRASRGFGLLDLSALHLCGPWRRKSLCFDFFCFALVFFFWFGFLVFFAPPRFV